MDSLAAHAQAAVSGQNDQKGTFAVKVRPVASAPALAESRARAPMCTSQLWYPKFGALLDGSHASEGRGTCGMPACPRSLQRKLGVGDAGFQVQPCAQRLCRATVRSAPHVLSRQPLAAAGTGRGPAGMLGRLFRRVVD